MIIAANGYFLLSWVRHIIPIIILTVRERFNAIRKIAAAPTTEHLTDFDKSRTQRPITPEPSVEHTPIPESLSAPNNTSFMAEASYVAT